MHWRNNPRKAAGWLVLAAGEIGLLAAVSGCNSATVAQTTPAPPKVTVQHPIVKEVVDEDEYSGWLRAKATVEVRSRVRGHIKKVHFQDGDLVKEGQLLFELDPRPFTLAIDQATAQRKAYEAQKVAAEKEAERDRELVKTGAVSKQDLEQAEATAQSFDAQIAAKTQDIEGYKLDLEYSRITAPIDGRIGRAMLTEGNLVNAGGSDPLLATIVSVDPMYVYFNVDERSLQRYRKSHRPEKEDAAPESARDMKIPFRFALDTDEGFPHEGVIDFADNQVDAATGTIEVRGVVDNKQGVFISGSRVRVRIPITDKYEAMLVPDVAVGTDQDQKYLLVLNEQDEVKRCTIKPGRLQDDGLRIVLQSTPELKASDWIIVEGIQRARLNYPVEPIKETTQTALAQPFAGEDPINR